VISAVIAMTIFPHGRDFGWRIYGFIGQPNYLGTFLAMAILVALGTHSKYRNFDKFIAIPIMLYALAWTGSRSSILGLAIGFCFMNREYAKHILLAGILAVGVTGYMRGASQMSDISRVATFRAAMAGVSHTILLGHGPASFIHVLHLHDDGTWRASRPGAVMQIHAHNPFLEAMSSSGLLGLIAFTLLCLYLGEVVLQDEDAAIQGAIAAACVAAQFNPIGLPAKALLCALVGTCMPESIGPRWQKLLIIPAIISAVIWLIVDLRGLGII
jgi:O-antigen ligase